jgi:hypothetical protein
MNACLSEKVIQSYLFPALVDIPYLMLADCCCRSMFIVLCPPTPLGAARKSDEAGGNFRGDDALAWINAKAYNGIETLKRTGSKQVGLDLEI